ncbi:MAG: HIT domain-containing protein [Deferribacteraceae bacterium]|jgi:ATP adenylyltransferase|nr:HIT domain-containing protein [Deferribacteraceae bacterium]
MSDKNLLWAPWRGVYVTGKKPEGCVFCKQPEAGNDAAHYIVHRGESIFVMMNLYPYNNGHLMLIPYRHISDIIEMTDSETTEMAALLRRSIEVLRRVMSPEGFNIGYNMGAAAGAGIAAHLHQHIVPRWNGDTNFMPVVAEVKVISEHMDTTYAKLKAGFEK